MNKQKVIQFSLFIFCILIIVCLYQYETLTKYPDYSDEALQNLKAKIDKELLKNDINDYSKKLILDNICGLKNKASICYFNAIIQMFFSNRNFTYFLISSKFENQSVSKLMQRICYKMLTNKHINFESEILILAQYSELTQHLKLHTGGSLESIIVPILTYMRSENYKNYQSGSPMNYINTEIKSFKCKCGKSNIESKQIFLFNVECFDDVDKLVQKKINKTYESASNKNIRCVYCKSISKRNLKLEYLLSNNLIIKKTIRCDLNEYLAKDYKYVTNTRLKINNKIYELQSIICISKLQGDYHANTLIKKGPNWYLANDSSIKKIDNIKMQKGIFHSILSYKCIKNNVYVKNNELLEVVKKKQYRQIK